MWVNNGANYRVSCCKVKLVSWRTKLLRRLKEGEKQKQKQKRVNAQKRNEEDNSQRKKGNDGRLLCVYVCVCV